MLEISPRKVTRAILYSREIVPDGQDWDGEGDHTELGPNAVPDPYPGVEAGRGIDAHTSSADLPGDAKRQEFREFLDDLGLDERASLIALAWIGRGTYAPGELAEAIAAAKSVHSANAAAYLFNLPLLPDYIEDALDQFGVPAADAGPDHAPRADLEPDGV